jgi:glycosyltransferase involved in cell wall biosynthesis
MKIVIDAREYPTSTGRYVRKLIENLEKLKSEHEFVILLLLKDFDAYTPQAENFSKLVAPFQEFTFSEQIGFLRFCRNLKADLVHFPIVQQPIFYRGKKITSILDLTSLRFKNPLTPQMVYVVKKWLYSLVIKSAVKHSSHIITISDYVKNDLLDYSKDAVSSKITTTYNSADKITTASDPMAGLQSRGFLLYVGRTFPHKNITRLIDAFGILQKNTPSLKLVLVGKKDELTARHLDYSRQKGIKNVIATGYVSEGQLRWLYENCAMYCFPSLSEGFGLPSLEAMAHGAPVASSNATCLPEVNGDAAHYFDPLDTEDIAEKINDILTNEELRKDLIKKGSEQVKKYSWKRMAEETLAVYDECLGPGE